MSCWQDLARSPLTGELSDRSVGCGGLLQLERDCALFGAQVLLENYLFPLSGPDQNSPLEIYSRVRGFTPRTAVSIHISSSRCILGQIQIAQME